MIDTLRADHLGCYGYHRSTSPGIDRLAQGGVVFHRAIATASNTLESVASFFTSTTALKNRIFAEDLPASYRPLQLVLREAGFDTYAIVANPWLKLRSAMFERGFKTFEFVTGDNWTRNSTRMTADAVMRRIKAADFGRRNYFYIHFLDPHGAYAPPVDYGFYREAKPARPVTVYEASGEREVVERYKADRSFSGVPRPPPLSRRELAFLVSRYDGEIRFVDDQIRRIVGELRRRGVLEHSLIAITSDHGEEFFEHGCFKHGFQLYNETIHVPFIVHAPGFLPPANPRDLISGIDFAPTLLGLMGVRAPDYMMGADLFSPRTPSRPVVFTTHYHNQRKRGLQTETHKVIHDMRTGEIEVFDLRADPSEKNALHTPSRELSALLELFGRTMRAHRRPASGAKGRRATAATEQLRRQLESLGYIQQ